MNGTIKTMKSYTLNRIKSGRLINERLLRIRPIELLTLSELKVGVEYDVYSQFWENRNYIGKFVSLEGYKSTFLFLRENRFGVAIGKTRTFNEVHPITRFTKSLPL